MMYLLDTIVISEIIKPDPDKNVMDFLSSVDMQELCLSVLSLGEIRKEVEKLENLQQKQKIIQWLETDLLREFCGRIIKIDSRVADKWGYIASLASVPSVDALIGASALVHNLKLITRNVRDFENIAGLEIINPWG